MNLSDSFRTQIPHDSVTNDNILKSLGLISGNKASGVAAAAKPHIHAHPAPQPSKIEPFSEDELQKYSLLRKVETQQLGKKLTAAVSPQNWDNEKQLIKMAVNFLGSGLMTGEKALDGMTSRPNFDVWTLLIKDLYNQMPDKSSQEAKIIENLILGLTKLHDHAHALDDLRANHANSSMVYDTAMPWTEKLSKLKSGETEPFYVGYGNEGASDASNHAQLIDVTRRNDGAFDVLYYTSTHFELADTFSTPTKIPLYPDIPHENIPENALLFNSDKKVRPGFLASLADLKLPHQDTNHRYGDKDVLKILDNIEGALNPNSKQRFDPITGQRGPTCLPSVTKVWIRNHSHYRFLYKQIQFHSKLTLLAGLHAALSHVLANENEVGEKARQLLRMLALNQFRRVPKMLKEELIDNATALQANATAQDVLNSVKESESLANAAKALHSEGSDLTGANVQRQREARSRHILDTKTVNDNRIYTFTQQLADFSIEIKRDANCAASLLQAIQDTERMCSSLEKSAFMLQIHHLVDQIPLPMAFPNSDETDFKVRSFRSAYWDKFTPEQLIEVQKSLYTFVKNHFFNRQEFTEDLLSRRFATLLPLHVLFHFLSLKIEANKFQTLPEDKNALLESYPMVDLSEALHLEGLQFFDRHEFQRITDAAGYIRTFNAHQFENPPLFTSEKRTSVVLKDTKEYKANGCFFHALKDLDEKIHKGKLGKKVPSATTGKNLAQLVREQGERHFPDLKPEEIKAEYNAMQDALNRWNKEERVNQQQWADYDATVTYERANKKYLEGKTTIVPNAPPRIVHYGDIRPLSPRPPNPIEKRNLPDDTKATLVMGAYYPHNCFDHVLSKGGYAYVNILREMSHSFRHALFEKTSSSIELYQIANRKSPFDTEGILEGVTECQEPDEALKKAAWDAQRPVIGLHQNYRNLPLASRQQEKWSRATAEGKALDVPETLAKMPSQEEQALFAIKSSESLLKRLLRPLSEWELTPHQMMYELLKEFKQLQDPSLQSLLIQLLFRSPILQSNKKSGENQEILQLGFGQLIVDNSALFDTAKTFINKGLFHGSSFDQTLAIGCFFFEMSFYLSKFLRDAGEKAKAEELNQLEELKRWIEQKHNLKDDERSILHLYKVCFYSLKPALNETERADLFASWILYKMNPPRDSKWRLPYIESWAEGFIQKQSSKLKDLKIAHIEFLGSHIFSQLKLGALVHNQWKVDLGLPYLGNGEWRLNLATGQVYNAQGEIKGINEGFPWETSENFERVFQGERGFSYRSVGQNAVIFTHPTKGCFRLVPPRSFEDRKKYRIQKKLFSDSDEWFEYCPPNQLQGRFPNPLNYDHAYWVPTSTYLYQIKNREWVKGFLIDLKSLQIDCTHTENGKLKEADPVMGIPKAKGHCLDRLDTRSEHYDSSLDGFKRFDALENIVTYRDENDFLQKVGFLRYVSLDDNPLIFIRVNGRDVWVENREYAIPKQMPNATLGTVKNYLYLESVKDPQPGQGLLLVPLQEIELKQSTTVIADGTLKIQNTKSLFTPSSKGSSNEMIGTQKYVSFKWSGGKIHPTTTESKLFLAYIELSQKRHEEAVKLLQSIKLVETISPIGMTILNWIQALPKTIDHPDPAMVALHAFSLSMRQLELLSKNAVDNYFPGRIAILAAHIKNLHNLLQNANNISHGCRMAKEREALLFDILVKQGEKFFNKIQGTDPDFPFSVAIEHLKKRSNALRFPADPIQPQSIDRRTRRKENRPSFSDGVTLVYFCGNMPERPTQKMKYATHQERLNKGDYLALSDEEVKNKYKKDKLDFETRLPHVLRWLNDGLEQFTPGQPSKFSYTRPPVSLSQNGLLFLEVLDCTLPGREEARRDMLFRLMMWRDEVKDPLLDCMVMILCHPDQFFKKYNESEKKFEEVKIPNEFWKKSNDLKSEYKNKYEFLCHLERAYSKCPKIIPKETIGILENRTTYSTQDPQPEDPIPKPDFYEPKEIGLDSIHPEKQPLTVKFSEQQERWDQLNKWKGLLEKDATLLPQKPYNDLDFSFQEDLLSKEEEIYRETLIRDLEKIQKDYKEGKKINETIVIKTLPPLQCQSLEQEVKEALKNVRQERIKKESDLLRNANCLSPDETQRLYEQARIGGKIDRAMELQDCLRCLLDFDARGYTHQNANLNTADKIQEIAQETLAYVDLKSYEAQLQSILERLQKIQAIDNGADPASKSAMRRYLCHQLEEALKGDYHFQKNKDDGTARFSDEEKTVFRVFCGQKGMIPYESQINLIADMLELSKDDPEKYLEIVAQLIMGGGKTAVIAVLVLYLAAKRKGRIGMFIVPPAHFNTFCANFSDAMMTAFGKEIIALNLTRPDFTPDKLENTKNMLHMARDKKLPIIICASTLQGLELEELSGARKIRTKINQKAEIEEKLKSADTLPPYLVKSLEMRKEDLSKDISGVGSKTTAIADQLSLTSLIADALLDEVHELLHCKSEVTYVDSEKVQVNPLYNQLMLTLFKGMISEEKEFTIETKIGDPLIRDVLKLQTNSQTFLSQTDYIKHIAPVLAKYVLAKFEPIRYHIGNFQDSFIRYASKQMPLELQFYADREQAITDLEIASHPALSKYGTDKVKKDITFLKHLKMLYGGQPNQKDAANLIAQTKHYICDVTSVTLGKKGERDYAPTRNQQLAGKIIRYLGINAPATTEFGYHWEAAAYFYQWAAAFKPTAEQILGIAAIYTEMAKYWMERNGERFIQTAEYEEFKEIYGIDLNDIHEPGKVDEALNFVSQKPEKLLEMAYELVARFANFTPERLTSDGFALRDLLASTRTMSATPEHVEGYAEPLAKRAKLSLGTEGRILHKFATRTDVKEVNPKTLFTVDYETVKTARSFIEMNYAANKSEYKQVRALIDSEGDFTNFKNNYNIAKTWLDFLQEKQDDEKNKPDHEKTVDPRIEAILFYHPAKGEDQSNSLYVYRKGAPGPDFIGSSTATFLEENFKLTPDKYVVFLDHMHKDATDITMVPDAIGPRTSGVKMTLNIRNQASMRLRQYLFEQDTRTVMSEQARTNMYHEGRTHNDIAMNEAKVQSIGKAELMPSYFTKQVHHLFRRHAVKKIREANQKGIFDAAYAKLVTQYEPFFTQYYQEEPFEQFGRLDAMENPKDSLKALLTSKLKKFEQCVDDPVVVTQVKEEAEVLEKYIDSCQSFPTKWKKISAGSGINQDVDLAIEEDIHTEVLLEIEREIELELKRYEHKPLNAIQPEKTMSLDTFKTLLEAIQTDTEKYEKIIPLKKQLGDYRYGFGDKKANYKEAFQQSIYGTEAFFHTCQHRELLPVFHPLQRPAKQIMVVQTKSHGYRLLLLSEHEAKDVQKHLQKMYEADLNIVQKVWLIQPDGSLLIEGTYPFQKTSVQHGLMEINAFNGNVDYIDDELNRPCAEKWLKDNTELKVRFLKLKTFRDKMQQQIFQTSGVIARAIGADAANKKNAHFHQCKKRLEREKHRVGTFKPQFKWQTKLLVDPKKISDLNSEYVPYLGIDPKATDAETKEALKHIDEVTEWPYLSSDEKIEKLNKHQFKHLREYQVRLLKNDQMKWLPPEQVPSLEDPSQIFRMQSSGDMEFLLSEKQAKMLKDEQGKLVPFVNPEFYKFFQSPQLIANVPVDHLAKIDLRYAYNITKAQLKKLTLNNHLKFLNTINQEDDADPFYHLFNSLNNEQLSQLHGDLFKALPKKKYIHICKEQIEELTKEADIPELELYAAQGDPPVEPGTWSSWVAPKMIPFLHSSQVHYLTKEEQIVKVSDALVPKLKPEQVRMIVAPQAKFLQDDVQIIECPARAVPGLQPHQISSIKPAQVRHLRGPVQIQAIPKEELFVHLTATVEGEEVNQIADVKKDQLKWIINKQVKGLSKDLMLDFKNENPQWQERVNHLIGTQVQSFDSAPLIAMTPNSLIKQFLKGSQTQFLIDPAQIQHCPGAHVDGMEVAQIKHIAPWQVPHVKSKAKVEEIPCTKELVAKMEKKHLRFITPKHVELLDPRQIQWMDCKEEVAKLGEVQIQHVIPLQVPFLDGKKQVEALPCKAELVQKLEKSHFLYLTPKQVELLSPEQVHKMNTRTEITKLGEAGCKHLDPWQVPYIDDRQVPYLGKKQLQFVKTEHVKLLKPQQIRMMDKLAEISLLGEKEIVHIDPPQVRFIDDKKRLLALPCTRDYVIHFEKKHFRFLTAAHAELLTPAQIRQMDCREEFPILKQDQWRHLSSKAFSAFTASEVEVAARKQELQSNMSWINPAHLHLVTNPKGVAYLSNTQIDAFGSAGFNRLDARHPLWKRITPAAVKNLNSDKVSLLSNDSLGHLQKLEAVRKVGTLKIVHLTRRQLIMRKNFQAAYVVGVLTLGVTASVVSIVAYLLFPILYLCKKEAGKRYHAMLDPNLRRVEHLFYSYIPAIRAVRKGQVAAPAA